VLDASQIQDVQLLQQIVTLQDREITRLHARLAQLVQQLAQLRGHPGSKQLELELMRLQEQLAAMQQRMYGPSSEKRPSPAPKPAAEPAVRRGHGPTAQPQLPCITERHELAAADRDCPLCRGVLTEMKGQTEDSQEVTVVERKFVLVTHQKQKYRCRCNEAIVTAKGPAKLIPGGRYSLEFAVEVALQKYDFHMPLERQARKMASEGLRITPQTLWDQLFALAQPMVPTYNALRPKVLSDFVVHMDETPWKLLTKAPSKTWQVWCLSSELGTYYHLDPHRSGKVAQQLLEGFEGALVTDGLAVYQAAARGSPKVVLVFCWAHVRRRFLEAQAAYPQSQQALELISAMYAIERQVPALRGLGGEERAQALALRAQLRASQTKPLLKQLWEWSEQQECLPQSRLRMALDYMRNLWPGLVRFAEDPRLPMDNNAAENDLRSVVVGRKNHYGSKSERGTQVAAIFYSLIETARHLGLDERQYLLEAARWALQNPGQALLPHQLLSA
jgi:transposase